MFMENLVVMLTRIWLVAILCAFIASRAVDGLSQPQIVKHSKTFVEVKYGKSMTLFCIATGDPLPSITWQTKWRKIDSSGRKKIEVKNHTSTKVSSSLTISNMDIYDDGSYKCRAKNINGSSKSVKIQVQLDRTPWAPENVKSYAVNSTSISVSWHAVEKSTWNISYYTLYYNADKETQINAVNITEERKANYRTLLTDLKQLTTYLIYITATNMYGEGELSKSTVDETTAADPEPPTLSLYGEKSTTDQTIMLKLVPSSENKRAILAYQICVENIQNNPNSSPLVLPEIYGNHSLNKSKDNIYIAADLLGKLPNTFTLGDERLYGFHFNSKLKPLTKYRIYIRALAKGYKNKGKIVFGKSNILEASTKAVIKNDSSGNSKETSVKLLIIIIVVGIIVVLLVVVGAVVYFMRRKKKQKEGFLKDEKTNGKVVVPKRSKQQTDEELDLIEDENVTERTEMELKPVRAKDVVANGDSGTYNVLEWECSWRSINVIRVIEYDNFGKICKGSVKHIQDVENGSVMMRILKDNPSESLKEEFSSMMEIMKRLPAHKGLINLLGCITKEDPLTMIIEYVPYGDLLGYLRVSRGLPDEHYKSEKSPINDLKSAELMSFAEQIAAAMAHLERYKIMHCDLSARNVLVDRKGLCKLTNFGEYPPVFDKDTYSTKKKGRLLIKWAAIEVVFDKIRLSQSDVWSFGVLLYEIATVGGCPYNGKDERWLLDMLKDDYRMSCPEHVSEALYSVMLECWKNDPNERPNFEKLVKVMRTLTLMNKHQDHINMTKYDGQLFSKLDDV